MPEPFPKLSSPLAVQRQSTGSFFGTKPKTSTLFSEVPKPELINTPLGTSAVLYFGKDSSLLLGENFTVVQKIKEILQFTFKPTVSINSYASGEGDGAHNQQLSEQRRSNVLILLGGKSLDGPLQYGGQAYGETGLQSPEDSTDPKALEAQRSQNRRVEITILRDLASAPIAPHRINLFRGLKELPPSILEQQKPPDWVQAPKSIKPPSDGGQSAFDTLNDKFDEFANPLIKRLPSWMQEPVREGAHSLIEKGTMEGVEKILKQTDLGEKDRDMVNQIIKSALQFKFKF